MFRNIFLALGLWSTCLFAVNENLERTTSISGAYDSRSVFTNPAALGFQTELNGTEFLANFGYGVRSFARDEFSLGLSLGYFGIGVEQLSYAQPYQQFSLAGGVPIGDSVFVGSRYRFTKSDSADWDRMHAVDVGLQWRPSKWISFGLLANTLNRPEINGAKKATQFIVGTSLRPVGGLEINLDVDTYSDRFAERYGYQAMVGYEVFPGLKVRAGYHDQYKFQAGLQFNFGQASLYSAFQATASDRQSFVGGLQFASRPYPSIVKANTLLKVKIDSTIGEEAIRGGLFSKDRPSFAELLDMFDRARTDDAVTTIAVKMDRFTISYAAAQELHRALTRLREAGKKVRVYLGYASLQNYLVATAADQIFLDRSGVITVSGMQSGRYYLKGTLDKIGVEGEFIAKGEYKSAPETFTRKSASEASREETLAMIAGAEAEVVKMLGRARNIDAKKWKQMLKLALIGPVDAKAMGLIDGIGGYGEAMDKAKDAFVVKETIRAKRDTLDLPSRIAVIVAEGDIVDKKIGALTLGGQSQITPDKMSEQFKRALDDSRTEAIVLRISSPGGEILPSDEIATMVENANRKKPVIVSMGSVAASGGYFIAAPATRIFADPLTVTGSIGVFLGKFNLGPLFKKIDLNKEILTNSPYPGLFSEDRPWSKEEREILIGQATRFYDSFITYVSDKRKMNKTDVDKVARGRVWTGLDAHSRKLVDETGGFLEAANYAAEKVGLREGEYDRWVIGQSRPLLDLMGDSDGSIRSPIEMISKDAWEDLHWMSRGSENPFLFLSPVKNIK